MKLSTIKFVRLARAAFFVLALGALLLLSFKLTSYRSIQTVEGPMFEAMSAASPFETALEYVPQPEVPIIDTTSDEVVPVQKIRVPILVYHDIRPYEDADTAVIRQYVVPPADFERQMKYLFENGYQPINFAMLIGALDGQAISLPEKPILIAFDDGWEGQIDNALPILERQDFVATFFLYTVVIGHRHYLTWTEAEQLVAAGMEIGAHGYNHEYLTRVSDMAILEREISGSKSELEKRLDTSVEFFAYPFGLFDDRISALVQSAGYRGARTIKQGSEHSQAGIFTLRGNIVTADWHRFLAIIK